MVEKEKHQEENAAQGVETLKLKEENKQLRESKTKALFQPTSSNTKHQKSLMA